MAEPSVAELQHWLSTVLLSRGDLREKLAHAARAHGVEIARVIAAPRAPSPERRLDVYAAGYVQRLLECLRCDFPLLLGFLGDSVFDTFARAYILEHPPASRSLFDLGRNFPGFLARTRPSPELVSSEHRPWLDLPANIARLERAESDALRAPGLEGERGDGCSALDVLAGAARVKPAPCLQLLELEYPLIEFCAALGEGSPASPPLPTTSWIAVSRSRWRVTKSALELWQYRFLLDAESAPEASLGELLAWLPIAEELGLLRVSVAKASPMYGAAATNGVTSARGPA